jgi:hypothetical protein
MIFNIIVLVSSSLSHTHKHTHSISSPVSSGTDIRQAKDGTSAFQMNFFLILNLAIGGTRPGNVIETHDTIPGVMMVDYVRVFQ